MYLYTKTSATVKLMDHVNHIWEDWHAYVNDLTDAPPYVDGNSTGLCCHTCQLIIVEV